MNKSEEFNVDLNNCDREPIHTPGRIQSHGVLLVFGTGRQLTHRSVNVQDVLGADAPALDQLFIDTALAANPELRDAVQETFDSDGDIVQPVALDVQLAGQPFELVTHRLGRHVIVELERLNAESAGFTDHAFKGHRALGRLKRQKSQKSIDDLLAAAVEEVRSLTGFDRVMAYRFRHDDSGDVVCEAKIDTLEPFAGRRYPAGDIPAQARRLYIVNTLRTIAEVGSPTFAIETTEAETEPLDMSHCVLRSVSPIHIEYLGNMGVAASMSISVVINGALWGMLACHHTTPRHVPYSVRSVCDVLAQILAANVQTLEARERAQRIAAAASARTRAIELMLHSDDGIFALQPQAPAVCDMLSAHALVVAENGRLATAGDVPQSASRALVDWLAALPRQEGPLVQRHTLADLPSPLREELGIWCGFLAIRFGERSQGWVVFLRKEQLQTIGWGGKPDKNYVHGPLGPRLTPRGSFDVWKETVRGQSEPWNTTDLEIANEFLNELVRASAVRGGELDRARIHLLALLSDGVGEQKPQTSMDAAPLAGGRMQRLVSQVVEAARLQAGTGLGLRFEAVDLAQLVNELIDEAAALHADTRFIRELPRTALLQADAQRLRKVVHGLITNARLHGEPGEPVLIQLAVQGDTLLLDVSNVGPEISPSLAESMFNPFLPADVAAPARKEGLGLSLYIAQQVVRAHGGDITYAYAEPYVMFSVTLPAAGRP